MPLNTHWCEPHYNNGPRSPCTTLFTPLFQSTCSVHATLSPAHCCIDLDSLLTDTSSIRAYQTPTGSSSDLLWPWSCLSHLQTPQWSRYFGLNLFILPFMVLRFTTNCSQSQNISVWLFFTDQCRLSGKHQSEETLLWKKFDLNKNIDLIEMKKKKRFFDIVFLGFVLNV